MPDTHTHTVMHVCLCVPYAYFIFMPKICNHFRFIRKFRYHFYLVFVYLSFTIIAIQKINYNNNYFWKTTARCLSV